MKFFTCYKWRYTVKGYELFTEDLEVEVTVNEDKTWKVSKLGFLHYTPSSGGHIKIWFEENDPLFKFICNTIQNDPKFNQSVLNETI